MLCAIAAVAPVETGDEVRDADGSGVTLRDCCWLPCLAGFETTLGDVTSGDGPAEFLDDLVTSNGNGRLESVKRDDDDAFDDLGMCASVIGCTSGFSALLSGGS